MGGVSRTVEGTGKAPLPARKRLGSLSGVQCLGVGAGFICVAEVKAIKETSAHCSTR